ncbi:YbhB/YbcL family Raf kinase inhibitor-like protein [Dyella sp. C11]|uniref:YbhB/YbcL family Raf kinase inhibitor-like protein n=1 Tax=Dyella sp. C11 TaxID=2126991 RepID=UPI0013005B25|nr:YbhB/YbcL family Raf kinase inhibitor-like protein [Dyella sp. C11]
MIARLLGTLLRGRHAGDTHLLVNELPVRANESSLALRSDAFVADAPIPLRYAGEGVGDNVSPPLHWSLPPPGTVEQVLVMEDPDAPLSRPFVHLVATGIAPGITRLDEGALNGDNAQAMTLGLGTFRKAGYSGPRALPGHGPHRYVFQLLALDRSSGLGAGARRRDLVAALDGKVLARGTLEGRFERP